MEEENMKRIYRVIPVIVIFCLLCGCSDINSDYNVDEDDEEIEIIKQETLFLEDTDYGPVNISYVLEYHGTGRNKDKYLNISIQLLDRPEKLHTVNMVHWIEGGMGGGLSYDPINEIYYRSSMFDNNFIDFWILFYEKGSEIWDANNGTTSNELVLKKTMSFSILDYHSMSLTKSEVTIIDISWKFNELDPETFNVTYNLTSSSDVRDIYIRYLMVKDTGGGTSGSSFQEESMVNGSYVKSIKISREDKEEQSYLLFSLSASNSEWKRTTSDVIWVPI